MNCFGMSKLFITCVFSGWWKSERLISDRLVELLVEAVLFLSGEALIPELTFCALPAPKRFFESGNLVKLGLGRVVAEE